MPLISDEQIEKKMQWSSVAGTVAAAKGVHSLLLKAAGDYYANGRDEIASAFRHFAKDYEKSVVIPQSENLQKFINGSKEL